jgi:lysophospholipase L1-like esterase
MHYLEARIKTHLLALLCAFGALSAALGQTRIMPLGDSITQGGQGYCSYRYELWFQLAATGATVDFVGERDFTNDGAPNLSWYPEYNLSFDRDHQAYWGWRTDQIAAIITGAASATQPEIVLIHLGTNDIGQSGAAGVANADTNLRLIIQRLRDAVPEVTILLAQVIPIGPGTSYFANANQVPVLNQAIATIAAELDTRTSRVVLVDQSSGFDLLTMMQSDGLHPNLAGEARIADVWRAALTPFLSSNPAPSVSIVSPLDGAQLGVPVATQVEASASDTNGSVESVSFYLGSTLLGVDTTPPYQAPLHLVQSGNHQLSAVARDNQGATRRSQQVVIEALPNGVGTAITIVNPSFEIPSLADGALAEGPGVIGGWSFEATPATYSGIFNPPVGSYPTAAGNGTPTGADGANAAYLFNNGGPTESVIARQQLSATLQPESEYLLRVAIGRFLPDQPYASSTYGGYTIELLAGSNVIASSSGMIDPATATFRDAIATVSSDRVAATLLGQPLSVRLSLAGAQAPRSTHFDSVRLTRFAFQTAGALGGSSATGQLNLARAGAVDLMLTWGSSCRGSDTDFAVYEGLIGDFASHEPVSCTSAGANQLTLTPQAGNRYYLVVPQSATREGDYGAGSNQLPRPAARRACLPRASSCP